MRTSSRAPAHLDVKVIGAIRRAVVRRLIGDYEGLVAVADFRSLPVRRWPTKPFVQRADQLGTTYTAADGVDVALSEGFPAPIITCDRRLAQSHGRDAEIELVA